MAQSDELELAVRVDARASITARGARGCRRIRRGAGRSVRIKTWPFLRLSMRSTAPRCHHRCPVPQSGDAASPGILEPEPGAAGSAEVSGVDRGGSGKDGGEDRRGEVASHGSMGHGRALPWPWSGPDLHDPAVRGSSAVETPRHGVTATCAVCEARPGCDGGSRPHHTRYTLRSCAPLSFQSAFHLLLRDTRLFPLLDPMFLVTFSRHAKDLWRFSVSILTFSSPSVQCRHHDVGRD
jgi:hypothetical protein